MSAPSEWEIAEAAFDPERLAAMESVFAVGNGYLGLRGAPEEGGPSHDPGVVLNGFHETWPIVYPGDAYGMARTGQTTVNATDGTVIRLFVDDEPLDLAKVRVVRRGGLQPPPARRVERPALPPAGARAARRGRHAARRHHVPADRGPRPADPPLRRAATPHARRSPSPPRHPDAAAPARRLTP